MKICQVTSVHDWKDDRIFERACIGLAEKGYDTHLIAAKDLGFYTLSEEEKKEVNSPSATATVSGVKIHWLKQRSGVKKWYYSSKEAYQKVLDLKPDIVHFHDPQLLPWMVKLKKKAPGIVVIYDIHENYVQFFIRRNLPQWLQNWFRKYEQRCVSKFDGFTAITHSLADIFRPYNKNNIIIPNVPFLSRLLSLNINQPKDKNPVFFTSGIQSDERNCRQLVMAMPDVISEYPNAILRMAGRFSPETFESELLELARKVGVEKNVELQQQIPWLDNFNRAVKSYAGLVTYKITENNKIGTPNRMFETMVCGLPVIATDLPELRKIVTENKCGLVVDSDNPKEIAKAINYLISHPEEAAAMGKRGREAVIEKYNYERVLDHTLEFYKQLLTRNSS